MFYASTWKISGLFLAFFGEQDQKTSQTAGICISLLHIRNAYFYIVIIDEIRFLVLNESIA